MTDGGGTTALTDLSATQAGAFTLKGVIYAATIGIKNASTVGQIDTANITVSDGDSTASEQSVRLASNNDRHRAN